MNRLWNKIIIGLYILLAVFDRYTKITALTYCMSPLSLLSCIKCHVVLNRGISWSIFHSSNPHIFGGITALIIGITGIILYHALLKIRLNRRIDGEMLICIGSFSNIIDRLWYGGVIDFLGISCNLFDSPILNFADMYIVCGALLFLLQNND